MSKKFLITVLIIFLIAINITFIIGYIASRPESIFTGLIQNPIDGNSYLAKMYQGYQGEWKFFLPYSIEHGDGAYLFLFYIFLGHISRWFSLPIIVIFHVARNAASIFLFFSIVLFIKKSINISTYYQRTVFLVILFGSGLGWIAALSGSLTSDFIVPEEFPFLSSYTNPHFPLGLALILLYLINLLPDRYSWRTYLIDSIIGLILSIVLPFGIVILTGIHIVVSVWSIIGEHKIDIITPTCLLGGGVCLLYQYFVTIQDPVLSVWNKQNITMAPPVWDLFFSLAPVLCLTVVGIRKAYKLLSQRTFRILLGWILFGMVLIYFPFNLQRRFMLGLFIPFSLLSIFGLMVIIENFHLKMESCSIFFISLSVITNILVLAAGLFGIITKVPTIYISRSEMEALDWIKVNTEKDSIILASTDMGLFIPAQTGRKVIYGHPFETIHAEEKSTEVEEIYKGLMDKNEINDYLEKNNVKYILTTARDWKKYDPVIEFDLPIVFSNHETRIYDIQVSK